MLAPPLARRLAALVYEGIVLFGLVMAAGLLYGALTQQRHALTGRLGLQLFLFVVLGAYFIWFWSRGGQTVAMKTWHIRLVDSRGAPVTARRALARYVCAWLWFAPALASLALSGLRDVPAIASALATGVLAFAALALLRSDRQFLHDVICSTRLIDTRPAPPRSS